jgi:hypothetical protein
MEPRILTCESNAKHRLGHVVGAVLYVYGTPKKRVTNRGREIWDIPRPRDWPTEDHFPKEGALWFLGTSARKEFEAWRREQIERESHGLPVERHDPPTGPRPSWRFVSHIPLPTRVKCWGCTWEDKIKPELQEP